jgi:hypothetical protein
MTTQYQKCEGAEREALRGVIGQNIEYVMSHDFQAWLANEPAAVQKRWGYKRTDSSHVPASLAEIILDVMRCTWTNHGAIGEPYSEATAIEVAINELFDYAMTRGLVVKTQGVEIEPFGVTVSVED